MTQSTGKLLGTDPELSSALRVSIVRLARRLRYERDASVDLSLSQLAVMGVLDRHGRMTVGELAAHERIQPPSMTRTVSCLENAGLVRREQHSSDGRQVLVNLTNEGVGLLEHDRKRRDAWLAVRLRELTPGDREVLRRAAPIIEQLAQT